MSAAVEDCESVVAPSDTARHNHGGKGFFPRRELDNPFAEGSFRHVAKGRYSSGPRSGQPMVCKWFKKKNPNREDRHLRNDLRAVNTSLEIIERWNSSSAGRIFVRMNKPEIWILNGSGRKVLVEPFINNFVKFNSNSGWNDRSTREARVMQALSHFSFHTTHGNLVLCDLQGGVRHDCIILSDPVILSKSGDYGATDLGWKGIESFFKRHVCTEYCRPDWRKPTKPKRHFMAMKGTAVNEHKA